MAPMSAPVAQVESRPPGGVRWALLTLVALTAVFTVGTLLWASGYGRGRAVDGETWIVVAFVVWALLPFLVMGAVVVVAARRMRGGMVVTAVGVVALTVLTVVLLLQLFASESSTAALVFLGLPAYQLPLVAVTAAATVGLDAVLRRRRARRSPPTP